MSCESEKGLDDARRKYQANGDYASLQMLAGHLKVGMSREQTEILLGDSGYSPVNGQYVYGTDRKEFVQEDGVEMYVYLVLSFRDAKGNVTNELRGWGFHPLGE